MRRLALVLALGAGLAPRWLPADAPDAGAGAAIDHPSLPAAGRQQALLTIGRFGRYALTVTSGQGTTLQIVDRMAGPGATSGAVGEKDGRLDLLLDRGEYKLVTVGYQKARGQVQLAARPFAEKNGPRPPQLVELKPVDASLGDFEQRSYWIDVKERRTLELEAAGRNLADLRLWKDGAWLVEAEPIRQILQPRVGRPLMACRLGPTLEPGLYLLVAYGGPGQAWAEDDGAHPFYLRYGIPHLGVATRERHVVGPLGVDRYVVSAAATYFRVELPEAAPVSLAVADFDPENPFHVEGESAEITKKTVPPVAEIGAAADQKQDHVVTVTGAAGQPYVLQHFEEREWYPLEGTGDYWLSTIHSGHPEDSVDATAIVTRRSLRTATTRDEPFTTSVVELDAQTGWARRANLLGTVTVFLHVKQAGSYEILSKGTEARFKIEPFLTSRPAGYKTPDFRGAGSAWDLSGGYFVLTIEPVRKGILDVVVRPKGLLSVALDAVGLGKDVAARPVKPAARFPKVSLDRESAYVVYIGQQPETHSGLVLRRLPVDLAEPLPVAQEPGETVSVPVRVSEAGTLKAEAADGALLDVAIDGNAAGKTPRVEAGPHTVTIAYAGAQTLLYTLRVEPERLQAAAALPELPEAALAALPEFPVLEDSSPRFADLERSQSATFLVRAPAPALYHLQSTGLLATTGTLRTRTVTSLATEAQNGTGRNFLIQQYLRGGDYQLTVAPQGQSAGHLGVTLERTSLVEGGFVTNGLPARISLPAGAAVAYRFAITKPGDFRVRAVGLGRPLHWRIEDEGGWPIEAPGGIAEVTRRFEPGRYRIVVLPEATDARVLTLIEPVAQTLRFSGHGPHPLPIYHRVEHVWLEPAEGEARTPDAWQFDVAAPITAVVELSGEMQGSLLRVAADGSATDVAYIPPNRNWKGALEPGRYRLDATSVRKNNRASYTVGVWPDELVPGSTREVQAPAVLPVSVGRTGLVELGSFGSADVRARLEDEAGRVVAANDDRPDDWNFLIARSLSAGRYRLRVDPVGATEARCTIAMRIPIEIEKPALVPPAALDASLGRASHLYPLDLPAESLLVAGARSGETVGLALEVADADAWRTVATTTGRAARLEIPLQDKTPARYRLRVWSLDRRDSPVHLSVAALAPTRYDEGRLRAGLSLAPVGDLAPPVGAATVALERPGLLKTDARSNVRWCAAPRVPCQEAASGIVAATSERLWVIADPIGRGPSPVRAARWILTPGSAVQVALPSGSPLVADLADGAGPVLVRVSSEVGQPGVALADAKVAPGPIVMAAGGRAAIAVALRRHRTVARVWAATPAAVGQEVRVEVVGFAAPAVGEGRGRTLDDALTGPGARAYALEAGPKRLHLALGEDVVAVSSTGDDVVGVHWAGGAPFAESVDSAADRLTLLHASSGDARYSVETLPLAPGVATVTLAPGSAYEAAQVRSGTLRLAVGAAAGTLHVRGASEPPMLVTTDGRVLEGSDVSFEAAGGTLLVRHGPGVLLAWIDRPGQEARDLWARDGGEPAAAVALPAAAALGGAAKAFRVDLRQPAVLHVRAAAPAATLLRRGDATPEVAVHPTGVVMDAYVPAGHAELVLRALGGATLSGTVELTVTPVTEIGEGLGPEVLLAPGATRMFSFTVAREGQVGVGVRASADVVEASLLSGDGRPIGTGAVQMSTLMPGTYLLALHAPTTTAPVVARPAVAGLTPPDTGPPQDVIRRYLEPEEAAPSFSATHVPGSSPAARVGASGEAGAADEASDGDAAATGDAEGDDTTPDETPQDANEDAGPGGVTW